MIDVRCPLCAKKLAQMCHDTAILDQGGRTVVVREIVSIQCDKCRHVFVPRMPKVETLEIGAATPTPKLGDIFSTETMTESPLAFAV